MPRTGTDIAFEFVDLSTGRSVLVPRDYRQADMAAMVRVLRLSLQSQQGVTWTDSIAAQAFAGNGLLNSGCMRIEFINSTTLANGTVARGRTLYALWVCTADRGRHAAWADAANQFINLVVCNDETRSVPSLPPTLPEVPFVVGFRLPICEKLTQEEQAALPGHALAASAAGFALVENLIAATQEPTAGRAFEAPPEEMGWGDEEF